MRLTSPARVLVTDAQERAVLGAIRCLSAAGADATAVGVSRLAPGLWSAAAHRRRVAPDPGEDLPGFIAGLERLLRAAPQDLLIPGTDAALLAAARPPRHLPGEAP